MSTIINVTPTHADGVAIQTDGHYKAGTVIAIAVEFSETVTVDTANGTPTLELAIEPTERTATYQSGSGTNTLTFEYVVAAGDETDQLAYTSTNALSLNGATIQSGSNVDANLTLASPGDLNSLSGATTIVVDTAAPTFDINPFSSNSAITIETAELGDASAVAHYFFEWFFGLTVSDNQSSGGELSFPQFSDWAINTEIATAGDLVLVQTDGLASGSAFSIGTTTNTFSLTDKAGNTATDIIDVRILDNESPVVGAVVPAGASYRVVLDSDGNATLSALDLDQGSTDNDSIAEYKIVLNPNTSFEQEVDSLDFTEANLNEEIDIAFKVYDPSDLSSEQLITLQIVDGEAPVAIAQSNLELSLGGDGTVTLDAIAFDNGSTDNRDAVAELVMAIASNRDTVVGNDSGLLTFDYDDIGDHTVTLTVTDSSGNMGIVSETVTIIDNVDPTASAQDFTLLLGSDGNATLLPTDIDNGSFDNTPIEGLTLSLDRTSFSASDVNQEIDVTLTVADEAGNSDTATATVTVKDELAPTVVPQNIAITLDGDGNATLSFDQVDNGSSDNVAIAPTGKTLTFNGTTASEITFGPNNLGFQTVTLTVTDTSGNISTDTAQVTINESIPPIVAVQNITAQLDELGTVTVSLDQIDSGSVDPTPGSGIATRELQWTGGSGLVTGSELTFAGDNIGPQIVTLLVTDNDGNSASANAVVTVADELAPILSGVPEDVTVEADAIPTVATVTAADNVDGSITPIFNEIQTPGASPNNYTLTRTWTATDAQGNETLESQIISVDDTTPPTVVTQDITVELDASGSVSITGAQVDNGSTDSVGDVSFSLSRTVFTGDDLGTNFVTLTVSDEDGNSATDIATVTVEDNIAPDAIAQAFTVELDALGMGNLTVNDINGGSTDNDQVVSTTVSQTSFSLDDLGNNTVTLTVSDRAGNIDTAIATVTVEDNIAPEVLTQDVVVQLDANGQVTIAVDDIDNGSRDAAGIQTRTLSQTNFDSSHLDVSNEVTLTVVDTNGNSATGTAQVSVQDSLAPVLSGVPADASVEANEVPNAATVTAVDNVDGSVDVVLNEERVDGANPNAYTLTRTWTATDARGNIATDSQVINVGDTILPDIVVQDITVSLDANGEVTITPDQIDNGSSDALGIASLVLDQTRFEQVGAFTVTLTATDNSGNVDSADVTVTVIDDLAPVFSADPDDISVEADVVPDAITLTALDNADGSVAVVFNETRTDGTSPNNYTLNRTWTAIDSSDNTATVTQLVLVDDTTAPTIEVQDVTVQLDATGQATIDASDIDNGSSDGVSTVTLALDITSFDGSDLGANTVTLTATDEDGNRASATATVTVEDSLAPVLAGIPTDISVEADAIPDLATVTASVTATDNVDGTVVVTDDEVRTDGNSPNSYTLTRTWTATDNQGNSNSAIQVISIGDTIAPTVITRDIEVALDESGTASITPSDIDNGTADTVSDVTLALDITDFDVDDLGSNIVTLSATDADNNSATGTATVTVVDTMVPTAIAQDLTISLEGGVATLTPEEVDNGSTDNTGSVTLSLDRTSFTSEGNYTVTLTVTDAANNSSTTTANIRVEENIPPIAVVQDITVELDENGTSIITPEQVDGGSTDNVGIVASSLSQTIFTADDLGENSVTLTVRDSRNNTDSAIATVTVIDALAPVVQTQDLELELNAVGTASVNAADIDRGSTDNVAIASSSLDITQFGADDLDTPATVTLTVTDTSGNVARETALVTVVDRTAPIANAQNITLPLDAEGNGALTAEAFDGGSADNVAIASLNISQDAFTIDDLGPSTVTLTVTDTSGNQATDTATVTVVDVLNPTVIAQDTTISLDETGVATLTPADIDGGSSDNGEITSLRLSQTRFTTADLGRTKSVTLTATDQSGNAASAVAQVTIADTIAPTVVTQDVVLYLDEDNQATLSPSQVNNGSSDNVAIVALALDRTDFTSDDLGDQTVTLTVTDSSGNSATDTAQVTVQESGLPTPLANQVFTLTEHASEESFVGSVFGQTILGTLQNWRIDAPDFDQDSVPAVRIDANTGVVRVLDSDDLNFEANPSITAFVTVSNGIEDSNPMPITLSLTDQNEAASLTLSDLYPRLSESLDTTNALKVADIAIADDALGTNQLAIAGTDPELFEIQGSALYLKAGTTLDFEAKPIYSALVTVEDSTVGTTPDDAVLFAISLDPDTGLISGTTDENTITASGGNSSDDTSGGSSSDDSNTDNSNTDNNSLQPQSTDSGSSSGSFSGTDSNDVIKGTRANDRLFGFGGNDRLRGKRGKDKLNGGDGDDVLIGQGQRDRLIGGNGDDTLIGGKDRDKLTGGSGSDTFIYRNTKDGRDIITDFTIGEDVLDISRVVQKIRGVAQQDLLGSGILSKKQGKHTILQIDTDGLTGTKSPIDLVKLKGVNPDGLNPDSFIL